MKVEYVFSCEAAPLHSLFKMNTHTHTHTSTWSSGSDQISYCHSAEGEKPPDELKANRISCLKKKKERVHSRTHSYTLVHTRTRSYTFPGSLWYPVSARREFNFLQSSKQSSHFICCGKSSPVPSPTTFLCTVVGSSRSAGRATALFLTYYGVFIFGQSHKLLGVKVTKATAAQARALVQLLHSIPGHFSLWWIQIPNMFFWHRITQHRA